MQDQQELLWRFHELESGFQQHQDTMRSTAVNLVLIIAGAVVSVLGFSKAPLTRADLPMTIFLVFIGIFGAIFAWKLHERYAWHEDLSDAFKKALNESITTYDIEKAYGETKTSHEGNYPFLSKHVHQWHLWVLAPGIVAIAGGILTLLIFYPIK